LEPMPIFGSHGLSRPVLAYRLVLLELILRLPETVPKAVKLAAPYI
jgi:hypothetical protein